MYVVAINGSPKPSGNTATALSTVLKPLQDAGIQTNMITIGSRQLYGCVGCGACARDEKHHCVRDDGANDIFDEMRRADGLIIGSPVYYGGISGPLKCLLDRAFYSGSALMRGKVCAAMVVQRRSGGMDALRQIENYFALSSVYMVPTNYWSILHGAAPGEVAQDAEGMANATSIGMRMAQMLTEQFATPLDTKRARTNFIR